MGECYQTIPDGYVEPKTMAEAEQRRAVVSLKIEAIQAQLGEEIVRGADGRPLSRLDAEVWRRRTKVALRWANMENRLLKNWMTNYVRTPREKRPQPPPPTGDIESLIENAFVALRELAAAVRHQSKNHPTEPSE